MDDKKISEIVEAVKRNLEGAGNVSYIKENITLDAAKHLADKVEAEAKKIGVRAVIAIANSGANPVLVHATDDSFIASFAVAVSKAYTSVSLKMATADLKPLANPGGPLYGIQFTDPGKIAVFGGGDPLKKNGTIIGAIGVSGGTEEEDTYLSAFGAKVFGEEF